MDLPAGAVTCPKISGEPIAWPANVKTRRAVPMGQRVAAGRRDAPFIIVPSFGNGPGRRDERERDRGDAGPAAPPAARTLSASAGSDGRGRAQRDTGRRAPIYCLACGQNWTGLSTDGS